MKNLEKSFLGTGWSFPPTFSRQTYSIDLVSDERDIHESLHILFSTSLGERIMVPNYGSQISELVFRDINTTLATQLQDYVRQAILYWEARINVDEIIVQADAGLDGVVLITVYYTVRRTNARNNFVYPFYLNEKTISPEVQ